MAVTPTNASSKGVFKRLLIGRAVASNKMEHTLLPKSLALPVFSSDALSSVAYATEEILAVMLSATTIAVAATYLMPITLAIATLLAVVVVSYRQTVKAYPNGGGAYIVSKANLGLMPGLIAAAALLIDYVLTVSVSVTAGVLAISSAAHNTAFDWISGYSVWICLGFIAFITLMNIRGVKESGTLFAIPTYGFIAAIGTMAVFGMYQCLFGGGCPQAPHVETMPSLDMVGGVSLFLILKAFSSGSTALTGVEAISNGVQAFRRPQSKNASSTLAIMGVISISMFVTISYLASQAGVTKSDEMTVVAQIADGVFNGGAGFYIVQAFTAAILILAANTAYQDFPRLSSILAADHYMPRQFQNRGDRLVFSNGVIGLGALAGFIIWIFDAKLDTLIQLYVLGVFTSFTFSQSGMIRHWLDERNKGPAAAKGWRRSIVINIIGATCTGVVLLVVLVTKWGFPHPGSWMVVIAAGIIVFTMHRIHRHYASVQQQVHRGLEVPGHSGRNHVVLLVTGMGPATAEALSYVRSFVQQDFLPVWLLEPRSASPEALRRQWADFAPGAPDLEVVDADKGMLPAARGFIRAIERDDGDFVTVVIPEMVRFRLLIYLLRRRKLIRLKSSLLGEPGVVVTDAPFLNAEEGGPESSGQPWTATRTEALVFVSGVNDASIRAVNYALTLRAARTRVIHFALDPEHSGEVLEQWAETGYAVPLEMVEAPFRDLTDPMLDEVRAVTAREGTLAAVVIPEMVLPTWRHMLLHNQNALFVKRLFLYEPRVVLTSVPYVLTK